MKLQRKEVIDELAKKSGFYKKYVETFLDSLEEVILENLSKADFDEDVEIQLVKGFTVGAVKNPAYNAKDPRNQNDVTVPEKIMPYTKFTYTFKQKINE